MITVTLTARRDGAHLHTAVIDLGQDVDAQVKAIFEYLYTQMVQPAIQQPPISQPPPSDETESFALQAAVTAYRLVLAAEARRKAEGRALPPLYINPIPDADDRTQAQRVRELNQGVMDDWLHAQPDTPEDIQARADRHAAWKADVDRARAANASRPFQGDPDEQEIEEDDDDDRDDDRPSASYREDWYPQ